jgi:zinc protease
MVPSNVLVPTTASVHEMPNAKLQTFHIAGKTSAALQMGIPINISRRDNDFMPLRLAAMVLGNGFTGRLMQKVRDEAGLTYGIYADVIGGNPGMAYGSIFKLQSSFNPKVFYEGKDMAMGIVRDWAKNGVTAEELEKQRGFWLGHRSVNLDEPRSEIQMLHCDTCDNVELKDMDLFESRLNKITLKQVNAALRKYIQLDKLHVVEVGTLNPKQ